ESEATLIALAADGGSVLSERERALAALARSGASGSVPALTPLLDDVRLRPAVARALGEFGSPQAVHALLRALSDERYAEARAAEVEALVSLRVRKVLPLLLRFLGTETGVPGGLEQWAKLSGAARAGGNQLLDLRLGKQPSSLRGAWACRATLNSD